MDTKLIYKEDRDFIRGHILGNADTLCSADCGVEEDRDHLLFNCDSYDRQ